MDAPTYPPAATWSVPEIIPQPMTTHNASYGDFLANPAAKAIVVKELPYFEMMAGNPQVRPHLWNITLRAMADLGAFDSKAIDRIDAQFAAAGIMQGVAR